MNQPETTRTTHSASINGVCRSLRTNTSTTTPSESVVTVPPQSAAPPPVTR